MSSKAMILDIQRLSTEDGPGLRTTVFFKHCNLKCVWCHNPESLSKGKQIEWNEVRCMGCGMCKEVCKNDGISLKKHGIKINRSNCISCEACVKACPTLAMEVKGAEWGLEMLLYEVLKDRNYFGVDGGITVSGGECLLQSEFLVLFLNALKKEGIHTAVDTAGNVPTEILDKVLPYTDLVLYDLKLFDTNQHKKYTGADNGQILQNARYAAEYVKQNKGIELWVRTPIIPNITDTKENIACIGKYIKEYMEPSVTRWELLAFNNLCKDKYERLDMTWKLQNTELLQEREMDSLYEVALKSGVNKNIVKWTGATKTEV